MSLAATRAGERPNLTFRRLGTSASLKTVVLEWRRRTRGRSELAGMTERDRHDLGYSSCDVEAETSKPFWRP